MVNIEHAKVRPGQLAMKKWCIAPKIIRLYNCNEKHALNSIEYRIIN